MNTFAFPDSSDVETEDYGFSDEETDRRKQASSEDGVSVESPSFKVSRSTTAIDLTRDDSHAVHLANRIDLTGETNADKRFAEVMDGRPVDTSPNTDPIDAAHHAEKSTILLDSEDEDVDFSSDSEDQSEGPDSADSSFSGAYDLEEMEIPEDLDDCDQQSLSEPANVDMQAAAASPIISDVADANHETPNDPISDTATYTKLSVDIVDRDDDDSELGLSDAGAEGISALFEGSPSFNNSTKPLDLDELDQMDHGSLESSSREAIKRVTFASETSFDESVLDTSSRFSAQENVDDFGYSTPEFQQPADVPLWRQPSPSDAALVKSAAPTALFIGRLGACDFGVHSKPAMQSLGERTGKADFFNAREANKKKFDAVERDIGKSMDCVPGRRVDHAISDFSFSGTNMPYSFDKVSTNPLRPVTHESFSFGESYGPNLEDFPLIKAATSPLPSFSFLDKPDHTPVVERAPSPELNMTSAAEYNKSKASMASSTNKIRSGLSITDIIDSSSTTHHPQRTKRKADDISDVTEAELRMWASSSYSEVPNSPGVAATDRPAVNSSEIFKSSSIDAEPRPPKRFKKFMENVAYAALGGVAAGAGLFSVLVATAPDFM